MSTDFGYNLDIIKTEYTVKRTGTMSHACPLVSLYAFYNLNLIVETAAISIINVYIKVSAQKLIFNKPVINEMIRYIKVADPKTFTCFNAYAFRLSEPASTASS